MKISSKTRELLRMEFEDLLSSDPDFNYNDREFEEWVADCVVMKPPREEKEKYVCSDCGGSNVHVKVWIDANTEEVVCDLSVDDKEGGWCEDCNKHVYVVAEKYFGLDEADEDEESFTTTVLLSISEDGEITDVSDVNEHDDMC